MTNQITWGSIKKKREKLEKKRQILLFVTIVSLGLFIANILIQNRPLQASQTIKLFDTSQSTTYTPNGEPVPVTTTINLGVEARVTKYLATGNKMASGKMPYIGAVASSDRTIPFGTRVMIDGKEYIVEDRTALWVHATHGLTFDIYTEETKQEALNFGSQKKLVTIINKK
jgi:3D (Asp-Asp-Asp) domain-containing protein